MRPARLTPRTAALAALLLCGGCRRSSLADLPIWRVDLDPDGREVRLVELPYRQVSYDMATHAVIRDTRDRNQDGISDRIVTYEGFGGARTEETDTNFDGVVDLWATFGSEGQRLRSASASRGSRPDRVATYERSGLVSRVESDLDFDGRFEHSSVYEKGALVEVRIDSDANGRIDRVQDFRPGYLSAEEFDTDEDGAPNLRMAYARSGALTKVTVLTARSGTGR